MKYLAGLGLMLCCAQASAFELPLFAKEAREQGYTLPSPYGVSIGAMHVDQDVVIDKIAFSGLKFLGNPLPDNLIDISAAPGSQDSQVFTVRGDVWVLPFLNLYAVGGKMKGTSATRVTINKLNLPTSSFFLRKWLSTAHLIFSWILMGIYLVLVLWWLGDRQLVYLGRCQLDRNSPDCD